MRGGFIYFILFFYFLFVSLFLFLILLFSFALTIDDNPLAMFVELPEEYRKLKYSNILCGVIRGALEMLQVSHVLLFLFFIYFIFYLFFLDAC